MSCNKSKFWSTILFVAIFLYPIGQYGQMDSLLLAAKKLPPGKEKIDVWIEIAYTLSDTDTDRCALYCDSIINASAEIGYEKGKSRGFYYRSLLLTVKGENIDALSFALLAMEYATAHQDTQLLITRHNNLGSIYSELELFEKACDHLLTCAELSEITGDKYSAAVSYYNLGSVFFDLDNYPKTKQYILLATSLLEEINNYKLHCILYDALASVIDDEDEAYALQLKALKYCQENETPYYLMVIYNNIGVHFNNKNDYEQAKYNLHLSLKNALEYNNAEFIAQASKNLAESFYSQGQLDSALYYNLMGLKIAEEAGFLHDQQTLYNQLGEIYAGKHNFEKAYEYSQKAFEIRDSIYESDIEQQLQINADQFQLEYKEKQIAEQNLELAQSEISRNRMVIFGLVFLSIVIAVYQWYVFQQQKHKQAAELKLSLEQDESLRLRELDKIKTNFFTNISHELRTPLTLILSPIADIIDAIQSKPIRNKLGIVQRNAQRLLNLVNEIMDLSKVEIGKLESIQSDVQLNTFIKRIFSSFESLAGIRRIKYQLKIDINEVSVLLDRDKFEKILHNLLSNAIKYTGAGGTVSLCVFKKEGLYNFEVKDTGQGIHPDDQDHIFDRFYQAQNNQQAMQGGTGIGLALVKELTELLGGTIDVKSKPGEGSTFCLSLFLEEIEANRVVVQTTREDKPPAFAPSYMPVKVEGGKPRVLIVEDHPEMGRYLLEILSDHYQCVLATDGIQAIKQMKLADFDCITSDVMMPNMDGFTLREKINEHSEWRQIPFLLLTARYLEEDILKGFQLGIDDYVTKPFSTRELHARIHNLIANKLERSAYQKEDSLTEEVPLSVDQNILAKLEQAISKHIDNEQFKVDDLAKAVNYSSKQMGRIIKKHTGMSSVQFILEIRLQKARGMLEKRLCASVSEVQYAVGIQSTSYFTSKFTERFGKNPSSFFS